MKVTFQNAGNLHIKRDLRDTFRQPAANRVEHIWILKTPLEPLSDESLLGKKRLFCWDNYYNFRPMIIRFISNPNLILKLISGIRLDPT
mgnify:CR=1 FL=1